MKVGFCSLYGLANAGKSTILNAILKTKIEAVSEKPQTTRENIQGIYNDEDSQIVFVDTPGLHDPHHQTSIHYSCRIDPATTFSPSQPLHPS